MFNVQIPKKKKPEESVQQKRVIDITLNLKQGEDNARLKVVDRNNHNNVLDELQTIQGRLVKIEFVKGNYRNALIWLENEINGEPVLVRIYIIYNLGICGLYNCMLALANDEYFLQTKQIIIEPYNTPDTNWGAVNIHSVNEEGDDSNQMRWVIPKDDQPDRQEGAEDRGYGPLYDFFEAKITAELIPLL